MGILFKTFFLLIVLVVAGTIYTVITVIDDRPDFSNNGRFSSADLSQAQVFVQNRDPRNLEPGEVSAFTMSEEDISLLLNYALSNFNGGTAIADISQGRADLLVSAGIPETPFGNYVNLEISVSQWGDAIEIERLRMGGINIPGWMADSIMQRVHTELHRIPEYVAALDAINGYSISDNQVHVVYQWQPDLLEQISNRGRDVLISEADRERLMAHAGNLSAVTNTPGLGGVISLAQIMGPMFQFAKLRGGDPVEENRAALLAMSMYIMGMSTPRVLGQPEDSIPAMGRHKLTLSDRHDFAQHFLVSAGLTLGAGTGVADTIGLLKEMDDADGGSGFSFTDIGADRAGVRVAQLAVSSRDAALAVQDLLGIGVVENVFMAEFRDLPEFMPQETFEQIYGEVDSPGYNAVIDDIENRISSTPLFQGQ